MNFDILIILFLVYCAIRCAPNWSSFHHFHRYFDRRQRKYRHVPSSPSIDFFYEDYLMHALIWCTFSIHEHLVAQLCTNGVLHYTMNCIFLALPSLQNVKSVFDLFTLSSANNFSFITIWCINLFSKLTLLSVKTTKLMCPFCTTRDLETVKNAGTEWLTSSWRLQMSLCLIVTGHQQPSCCSNTNWD